MIFDSSITSPAVTREDSEGTCWNNLEALKCVKGGNRYDDKVKEQVYSVVG